MRRGAAVSKQVRVLDEALSQDKHARSWWREIAEQIEKGD